MTVHVMLYLMIFIDNAMKCCAFTQRGTQPIEGLSNSKGNFYHYYHYYTIITKKCQSRKRLNLLQNEGFLD